MPQVINIFKCVSGKGNTGTIDCDVIPKKIGMAIATNSKKEFTPAEIEAMDVTLQNLAKADSTALRIYPTDKFYATTDNTTDPVTEETENGDVLFVRDGKPSYDFRLQIGECAWKSYRALFHNKPKNWRWILVDPELNILRGVKLSNGNFAGYTLEQLMVGMHTAPTGSTTSNTTLRMGFESVKEFESSAVVQFGSDKPVMKLVQGLWDFQLEVLTPITAGGIVEITATGSCGSQDMFDLYETNLNNLTAFVAKNSDTKQPINITGVGSLSPAKKAWEVSIDTADPNYPVGGSGVQIVLSPAAPSVLEAAPINMPGWEGHAVNIDV
jgi:hypothetical protein